MQYIDEVRTVDTVAQVVYEDELTSSLAEVPPNYSRAVSCFREEQDKAQVLANWMKSQIQMHEAQIEAHKVQLDISNKILDELRAGKKVTSTSLANFFTLSQGQPLVAKFYLDKRGEEDYRIYHEGKEVGEHSKALAKLSLNLEQFYGNMDIPYHILLQALKRYLTKLQMIEEGEVDAVVDYIEAYLGLSTTKKRTRIKLSELRRQFPEYTIRKIQDIVLATGSYVPDKTSSGIYFKRKP